MQPSAFREAFAPTARAMLDNVAVAGRDNAADAVRIVKAIWTDARMEDVWRELHRMSRAEPAAFHFPARAGQWLRRANATAAERQAAGVCYLAEQAAWTALQGWPTATDAEMNANGTKADAGYLLRVERHRTAADLRGFIVTMSGCACLIFGTPLHGAVATLAAITLGASVDGAQVKQMVRGLAFDLRRKAQNTIVRAVRLWSYCHPSASTLDDGEGPMAITPHAGRFIPLPGSGQKCPVTGLCRASIYNKAAEGELRLIKIGRSVRLDAEHAAQWLANQPTHTVKRTLPKKVREQEHAA